MFDTDPITGFFGKVKQIIPVFAKSKTNINPHHRTGTHPRLRFDKKVPRRLRLPKNMYSQKEFAQQKNSVAAYHKSLDKRSQRRIENRMRREAKDFAINGRIEHKANKPVVEV